MRGKVLSDMGCKKKNREIEGLGAGIKALAFYYIICEENLPLGKNRTSRPDWNKKKNCQRK